MRIGFLNPQGNFDPQDSYWTEHPDFGGQLVYVKELASAMAAQGHQVDIITRQVVDPEWPEFSQLIDSYPDIPNVRILRLPCGPRGFLAKERLWAYLGSEWVPNILKFYTDEGGLPDAFTTHYADGGLAGALIARKTKTPFTFTGHSLGAQKMDKLGVDQANLASQDARYHFTQRIIAERISMNHAGRVITSTSQERLEQYGHPAYRGAIDPQDEMRFAVIPPGVNRRIFSPQTQSIDAGISKRIAAALLRDIPGERHDLPLVLASSRLDPKKNIIGLVKAFATSPELRSKANIALAVRGLDDPLHQYESLSEPEHVVMREITEMIEAEDMWGCVTAFPLNSQPELAAAYRSLAEIPGSAFALLALYEPFGLAPLEAMSCGLPAVVTRNGGPSESMVEPGRRYGVLVDPADPADIARGLLEVTGSPATWQELQEAGISRVVDKYTWARTGEGYLAVLEQLLEEPARRDVITIPEWFRKPSPQNQIALDELARLYFRD